MSKRILVTGVAGFVGRHVAQELHSRGVEVVGTGHHTLKDDDPLANLLATYTTCDLTNREEVARLPLDNIDAVINLAGLAKVGESFDDPNKYKNVNVGVLTVLGERLLELNSKARVVAVSTGAVYDPDQPMPLTEQSKTVTSGSPYALSKLLMEKAATDLRNRGLDCIVARPFNHSGPGQLGGFLIPDLYQKVLEATQGNGIITVGNLKTRRDYTDVRDIVCAYADLALANTLSDEIYNVCSGTSRSGEEVLALIMKNVEIGYKLKVNVDKSLIRPNDPIDLYGSYERLQAETHWTPQIDFAQTIADFIAYHK